jgi:uncharacterized membrane protein
MTVKTSVLAAAVGSLLVLGMSAQAADKPQMEKCYGVAKAGKNDCAANGHACAGQAKQDGNAKEWVSLPKGTCDRIVGGSTSPK